VLRCDLLKNQARLPAKPKDCQLDWGNAFGLGERGKAQRLCVGDTVADPRLPVLAYGKVWSEGGFRCEVTPPACAAPTGISGVLSWLEPPRNFFDPPR